MKLYTLLKQDGTQEELAQLPKEAELKQLYEWLNCSVVEIIPSDYYQPEWGECIVWGNEEGRFNSENHRNPHTKVLIGNPAFGEESEWDCVGDLILEQDI